MKQMTVCAILIFCFIRGVAEPSYGRFTTYNGWYQMGVKPNRVIPVDFTLSLVQCLYLELHYQGAAVI
jgi:hypothetical protein